MRHLLHRWTRKQKTGHAASKQQLKLCTVHSNNPFIYSSACNTSDLPVGGVLFPTRAAAAVAAAATAGRHLYGVPRLFFAFFFLFFFARTGRIWVLSAEEPVSFIHGAGFPRTVAFHLQRTC